VVIVIGIGIGIGIRDEFGLQWDTLYIIIERVRIYRFMYQVATGIVLYLYSVSCERVCVCVWYVPSFGNRSSVRFESVSWS